MRQVFFVLMFLVFLPCRVFCQNLGIGTTAPNASAMLDVTASNKGILLPRMTTSLIAAITNPAKGLLIYDSSKNQLVVNMGSSLAPNWQSVSSNNGWGLAGNSGQVAVSNFIGTTDAVPLLFRINNRWAGLIDSTYDNTFVGYGVGKTNVNGFGGTAFGYQAMDTIGYGYYNTAFGAQAFYFDPTVHPKLYSFDNTAIGYQALYRGGNYNTTSHNNTVTGYQASSGSAVMVTSTGYQAAFYGTSIAGTATGARALNTGVSVNVATAFGAGAMGKSNTNINSISGLRNTATGYNALYNISTGNMNTSGGMQSLYTNSIGSYNVAFGFKALYASDNDQNTAAGSFSLAATTSSQGNTAIGYNAGHSFNNGYYNCFIGAETEANGPGYYNTVAIGHGTIVTAPNMMRVGNGATTSIGGPVKWSTISDGRVKDNVQENVPGLAFINKLRPVSYNIDVAAMERIVQPSFGTTADARASNDAPTALLSAAFKAKEEIVYSGFVAQEVEQAARSLQYNFSGVDAARNDNDLYGLRYAEFVVPLVKAVQELKVQQDELKRRNDWLSKQKAQILLTLEALEKKANR